MKRIWNLINNVETHHVLHRYVCKYRMIFRWRIESTLKSIKTTHVNSVTYKDVWQMSFLSYVILDAQVCEMPRIAHSNVQKNAIFNTHRVLFYYNRATRSWIHICILVEPPNVSDGFLCNNLSTKTCLVQTWLNPAYFSIRKRPETSLNPNKKTRKNVKN